MTSHPIVPCKSDDDAGAARGVRPVRTTLLLALVCTQAMPTAALFAQAAPPTSQPLAQAAPGGPGQQQQQQQQQPGAPAFTPLPSAAAPQPNAAASAPRGFNNAPAATTGPATR